ncbi:MAG: isoprenylcysteine carboxylmethyltransferase family protein [Nodularia sp. (in: cyanobacteria)]|nr:isoprenylcysteine carboxylmethyltransferase family protein [Nodularia sp. (in: cyanobacteria)]
MVLQDIDIKAVLTLSHSIYWFLITNASAVRRKGGRTGERQTNGTVSEKQVTTPKAAPALFSTVITYIMYYLLLTIWWFKPEWAGPQLLPTSLPLQIAGILLIVVALTVKVWAFWTFRSWRLYPQVDLGHQLVQSGPYSKVRHPLYFAFQLLYLGSFLLVPCLGFFLQFLANFFTHDYRCKIEESVLTEAFGNEYEEYKQRTSRLLPWVY